VWGCDDFVVVVVVASLDRARASTRTVMLLRLCKSSWARLDDGDVACTALNRL